MPPYNDGQSAAEVIFSGCQHLALQLWIWARGPGRDLAMSLSLSALQRLYRNMAPRRLFSLPHLLVLFWAVVLLWGERWVFGSKVEDCAWGDWEKWVSSARRLVWRQPRKQHI